MHPFVRSSFLSRIYPTSSWGLFIGDVEKYVSIFWQGTLRYSKSIDRFSQGVSAGGNRVGPREGEFWAAVIYTNDEIRLWHGVYNEHKVDPGVMVRSADGLSDDHGIP